MHKSDVSDQFFVIAGPCAVESESNCLQIAEHLKSISDKYQIPIIFKASYRKANRSNIHSFTGIGDDLALKILEKVKQEFDLPLLTDVHEVAEMDGVAQVVDVIQIPAFLCRQTALIQSAAKTQKWVNIKKGQFLSGAAMKFAIEKVTILDNDKVMLTERGNSFGYNDLVVDMKNIAIMSSFCDHVIFDATHSVQRPNQVSGVTGGDPDMISTLASAAISAGANGLFVETHPDPSSAKSDGANMLSLDKFGSLVSKMRDLYNFTQANI